MTTGIFFDMRDQQQAQCTCRLPIEYYDFSLILAMRSVSVEVSRTIFHFFVHKIHKKT